jgi:hypothetical protein
MKSILSVLTLAAALAGGVPVHAQLSAPDSPGAASSRVAELERDLRAILRGPAWAARATASWWCRWTAATRSSPGTRTRGSPPHPR